MGRREIQDFIFLSDKKDKSTSGIPDYQDIKLDSQMLKTN